VAIKWSSVAIKWSSSRNQVAIKKQSESMAVLIADCGTQSRSVIKTPSRRHQDAIKTPSESMAVRHTCSSAAVNVAPSAEKAVNIASSAVVSAALGCPGQRGSIIKLTSSLATMVGGTGSPAPPQAS
jgi:hypothetical protein